MNDSYSALLRRGRACACAMRPRTPVVKVASSPAEGPAAVHRLNTVLADVCGGERANTSPQPPQTLATLCANAKEVLEDHTGKKVLSTSHLKRLLDGLLAPSDALPCITVSADGQRLSWYCYDPQRDGWTSTLSRMGTTPAPTDDTVFQLARIVGFLTQADTPMSRAMLDSYLSDLTKRLLRTVHRNKNVPQYDPNLWVRRDDGEDIQDLPINLYTV